MSWRGAARVGRVCGVALAAAGFIMTARPAAAQDTYERMLAGIRLNSSAKSVLARYGNPNEVIIGDVGFRQAPPQPGGAGGMGGMMGAPGGMSGPGMMGPGGMGDMPGGGGMGDMPGGGGIPSMGGPMGMSGSGPMGAPMGMGGAMGAPMGMSGSGPMGAPMGAPMGGPPGGFGGRGMMGAPGGMSGPGGMGMPMGGPGGMPGGEDFPGAGGMPGGGFPGGPGGMGGGVGQFGQTVSTLARQQEVTWIYNRKINNNLVSYEFLIGPAGNVTQIRVSGYSGGNTKTRRGAALGSTYKQIVALYGYPEEHYQVGRILVASYRSKHHVQFQLMNERGQANPMAAGNKVVAITIATVE